MVKRSRFALGLVVLASILTIDRNSPVGVSSIGIPVVQSRFPAADEDLGPGVLTRLGELQKLAGEKGELQIKFVLPEFQNGSSRKIVLLRPDFYKFHDEWHLLQSLNGRTLPGMSDKPLGNFGFKTPEEAQKYLLGLGALPEGLANEGGRVVSKRFYGASSGSDRVFGLGSLIYSNSPKRDVREIIAFDMVFNDAPTEAEVEAFATRLKHAMSIFDSGILKWLPRSPQQERLADQLEATGRWKNKIVRGRDFVVPGTTVTYSPGGAAGRIQYFPKGTYNPAAVASNAIVILAEIPDDLPPVRAVLTTVPQPELSHLNLLARGRGTVNAFVGDAAALEKLIELSKTGKPVAIHSAENKLLYFELNDAQYAEYQKLFAPRPTSLPPVDVTQSERIYDLSRLTTANREDLIRKIGGKAYGIIQLLKAGLPTVPGPMALSSRAYQEHIGPDILPLLRAVLADARFLGNAQVRFLALEGKKEFEKSQRGQIDESLRSLLDSKDLSDPLVRVINENGIKNMIEKKALDPEFEKTLVGALKAKFPNTPKGQAFRFRSSSNIEDVPGFSGAGLYDSFSGFTDPATQVPDDAPKDKKKTVAWAVKKAWASYWNYRAFEERSMAAIDHLSGSMNVLVHPNFPTAAERANGVMTVTYSEEGGSRGTYVEARINAHKGETSVVRPDGTLGLPEAITVAYSPGSDPWIKREEGSDGKVLSDEQVKELVKHGESLARAWFNEANKGLAPERRNLNYVLDFEFKVVPEGWVKSFEPTGPDHLILKQVRPLMPTALRPAAIARLPIPMDFLGAASSIKRRTIRSDALDFETIEVAKPTTPYDQAFNAEFKFTFKKPVLGYKAGDTLVLTHRDVLRSMHGFMHHGPWDLTFDVKPEVAERTGIASFNASQGGSWNISGPRGSLAGSGPPVQTEELLKTPHLWVADFFGLNRPPEDRNKIGIDIDISFGLKNKLSSRASSRAKSCEALWKGPAKAKAN